MAINYNAGTNTITLDGVNTYSFNDIYNADVAGAWGVVSKLSSHYFLECHLVIGDAVNITKLVDNLVSAQIGTSAANTSITISQYSELNLTKTYIILYLTNVAKTSFGNLYLDDCLYVKRGAAIYHQPWFRNIVNIKNSVLSTKFFHCGTDSNVTIDNVIIDLYNYGSAVINDTTPIINKLTINNDTEFYIDIAAIITLRNSQIEKQVRLPAISGRRLIFVNCLFDPSLLVINHNDNWLQVKWEFNVLVSDKENTAIAGASVVLKDKNGVVRHTGATGADGKLPSTWEVLAERYDGTSETKTEYNPFTLTVTKAGYTDYETEITIDHIIDSDQIVLKKRIRRGDLQW